jgi:peptide/nickel transport system substrate-binding protein
VLAFLTACTAANRTIVHTAHVLRIADLADPSSLNPLLAHDQETIGNDLLSVQTLIGLDERNRRVPLLLTRIPDRRNGGISPDGLRITYHLRHGVRFADGVELTSKDVAFTYRAILDPRNNVLSQDAYRRIASLRTPDRYTVVITLKHPWNAAVNDLFAQSDFAFGILPAHAFAGTDLVHAAWEQHPFGTGPFKVAEWRRGDRIVFVPNPYFSPKPKLTHLELRMIPDQNSAFVALRTHEVDVAQLGNAPLVRQARSIPGLTVIETPENGTEWISLQSLRGPASDLRVREAIASAIDMAPIRKTFEGIYPQAGSFLPPVMSPWYDAAIAPHRYDLQRARALLRGQSVDAVLVVQSENPLYARIATVLQQEFAAAGIHATVKKYPTALFNAPDGPIRNARFTMAIDGWLGGGDPEQSIVFTCAQANVNGDNISRYCDPRFEQLFADQAVTADPKRRLRDFVEMQALVRDAIPVIPLYYLSYYDGVDSHVSGFARNMLQYPVAPERWDVHS